MNCPYCNQPMVCGKLYGASERGVYWLPDSTSIEEMKGFILQKKKVDAVGGIVLDDLYPVGFIAKNRPDSFYCKTCNIFLTKYVPASTDNRN